MASRSLADLDSRFLPIAEELLAACRAASIPVTIITTLRTAEEQAQAVAHGVSWTTHSRHLPQPPEGKSLAIDICPNQLLDKKGWAPADPLWWKVGKIGLMLGLRWGGDWAGVGPSPVGQIRPKWDPGHFEYVVPVKPVT